MAFFTGGGPSEAESGAAASQEEAAVVRRRLLGGLALTAAAAAFAIVPTERLQPAPSKPLFFYLVPLVRTQALLEEVERVVPEGDYEQLRSALARIQGAPNNVQDNLRSAAAGALARYILVECLPSACLHWVYKVQWCRGLAAACILGH